MCIIVDTNTFHKFKEPDNEDYGTCVDLVREKRWQNRLC